MKKRGTIRPAAIAAALALTLALLPGCGGNNAQNNGGTNARNNAGNSADNGAAGNAGGTNAGETTDAVTTASIVDNGEAFKKAISKEGTWIAATLNDLTFEEELVMEGEFIHRDEHARKIALYTQDADHNITNSFTLTAPKLTVRSQNARIQGGTFVGDIYVEADGFQIVNGTVEGNVYFANDQYMSTFSAADQGTVTGVTEVRN